MVGLENYYHLDSELTSQYDEIWVVMRFFPKKYRPIDLQTPLLHVPELSPSERLFRDFILWKEQGIWGEGIFREIYVPRFLREVTENPRSMLALHSLVYQVREGKNIALACTCYYENLCHRAILGGIVQLVAPEIECKAGRDYRELCGPINLPTG